MSPAALCSVSMGHLMRFETHDYYSYRIRNEGLVEMQFYSIGLLELQDMKFGAIMST